MDFHANKKQTLFITGLLIAVTLIAGFFLWRAWAASLVENDEAEVANPPPKVEALKPEYQFPADMKASETAQDEGALQRSKELNEQRYEEFFGRPAGSSPPPPLENEPVSEAQVQVTSTPATPEVVANTSDSDGDGLTSEQEASLGTDPNNPDTDADGLTDREEAETYKTNPILADTDGDSYADGSEVQSGYNPLGPGRCSRETCIP